MPNDRRLPIIVAIAALLLATAGVWLSAGAGGDTHHAHAVVGGVPLDEVHPPGDRHPGVVVAHGFAGSARLMAPFGDTLAARGYVVVLLDFSGHGANTHPMPDGDDALQHDLDVALAHLRSLPDVDPARIALVGHSMGATTVTRYAASHPDISATVAISLPYASIARTGDPQHLLLMVGALEFPAFHEVATTAAAVSPDRSLVVVPAVEHISILYAPRTHRETAAWLDQSLGRPADPGGLPSPLRRPAGAVLLLLAFAIGLFPLAWLLLGRPIAGPDRPDAPLAGRPIAASDRPDGPPAGWFRFDAPLVGRVCVVAAGAALVGALLAPILPSNRLPLDLGGYVVGLMGVTGALLLAYTMRAKTGRRAGPKIQVLIMVYAAGAITVPLQLGVTHVVPTGIRWWLLLAVWAAFTLLTYATERATNGNVHATLAVSAITLLALTGAAITGLTSSFVLLVVPLLALLMLWQAAWSTLLNRAGASRWLTAAAGSLLLAWPIATALPITGA
ncbi:alpha/beta fold hydrolase [Winogradskya consettensis]|uniref:Alpha/beta hydrolase n=1 Tax=Winogradskya consettensis TaxID=113560 RepID=A0A919T2Q1_9ACTN|nr:alpha/beta hydrolase [Actinoplanes consettensis]GIM83557.1 alpha/beta hydrolase [Actinoplanes consettensis]